MEHLPVERAKAAVRANPRASITSIAKLAKVGRATAQRAQKLVFSESDILSSESMLSEETSSAISPAAIDAEQEMKKKAEQFRAEVQKKFAAWTEQWLEEIGFDDMQQIIKEEARAWRDKIAAEH